VFSIPIMQLCPSAMESSARTIWILGESDRDPTRANLVRMEIADLGENFTEIVG
jgi:hypothetical protein